MRFTNVKVVSLVNTNSELFHEMDSHLPEQLMQTMRNIDLPITSLISVTTSPHERLGDALVTNPPTPHKTAEDVMNEIAHVHAVKDHALHVILSPLDCGTCESAYIVTQLPQTHGHPTVVKRGWGERQPLSGKIRALPKGNLIVYVPRTPDEVLVAANIVRAAIGVLTGSLEVF